MRFVAAPLRLGVQFVAALVTDFFWHLDDLFYDIQGGALVVAVVGVELGLEPTSAQQVNVSWNLCCAATDLK